MKIGVLNVQGAVSEHLRALKNCGVEGIPLKKKEEFGRVEGLILPGGESTTLGRLIKEFQLAEEIIEISQKGKALWGTCAGMILLAREIEGEEAHLALMDIGVKRNAYGRQKDSFEGDLEIKCLGDKPFPGVFIRAPQVTRVGTGVEVLSSFQDRVVAVREKNLLATTFHPELTGDLRFHQFFIKMVRERL